MKSLLQLCAQVMCENNIPFPDLLLDTEPDRRAIAHHVAWLITRKRFIILDFEFRKLFRKKRSMWTGSTETHLESGFYRTRMRGYYHGLDLIVGAPTDVQMAYLKQQCDFYGLRYTANADVEDLHKLWKSLYKWRGNK